LKTKNDTVLKSHLLAKEKGCRQGLRDYFKSIHEMLYQIERVKETELNNFLEKLLGPLQNEGGTREVERVVEDC
jgi:hypothetical protein